MKVCNVSRNAFYQVLSALFTHLKLEPSVIELGVLRGDNAAVMSNTLKPKKMVLIDTWSAQAMQGAFHPFDQTPPWIKPMNVLDTFYGGSIYEQTTFDKIFEQCSKRFADAPHVEIIRADTVEVLADWNKVERNEQFNLVYVDANHRYESVLRELLYWQNRVAENGVLMLNDCCHSAGAVQMNFGVLPALTEFVKRTEFVPILVTNTDWTDVVLIRKNSKLGPIIDEILKNSDIPHIDIPHQLLGSARVVQGKQRANLSFV